MKRLLPALLACSLPASSAQAQPDPVADARAALALVAANAVRDSKTASTGLDCVRPMLSSAALDDYRRERQEALADPSRRVTYEREGGPRFEWRQSTGYSGGSQSQLVDTASNRPLDETAKAIIRAESVPQPIDRLDSAWLDGVPFCGANPARSVLELSAPAISGDLAFVETGYRCGGLCGNGYLYALRRGVGGWTVAGIAWTWIS